MQHIRELQQWQRHYPDPLGTLTALYGVSVRPCEELGVVVLNYSQYDTPKDIPMLRACRGLVLDLETLNVVSRSFSRFFNAGEPEADPLDWETARVYEKLDGSLICLYHWRGEWQIATRGSANANGRVGESDLTFRNLVLQTMAEMEFEATQYSDKKVLEALGDTPFNRFTSRLIPWRCYSLELTAPENRVIVPHAKRRLTLLAAWGREAPEELPLWDAIRDFPCWVPSVNECASGDLETLQRLLHGRPAWETEGFVVRDGDGRRLKVKSLAYVKAATAAQAYGSRRNQLEGILSGEADDVWEHLSPVLQEECNVLRNGLLGLRARTLAAYSEIRDLPDQKAFALEAVKTPWPAALFSIRKGEEWEAVLRKTHVDRLLELLGAT